MNNPFSNKSNKSSHAQTQQDTQIYQDAKTQHNPQTQQHVQTQQHTDAQNHTHQQTRANEQTHPSKDLEEIAKLARQNSELIGDLQRTRADFENFRKQVELQREQAKTVARHATASKFLPLIDDMSRAIKAHPDLLAPVQKTLDKVLKSLNLVVIDSNPGTVFNPEFHNAISMEDNDGEKEVIAEELIPGYLYEGEVLRAAMVRVKHQ